MADSSDFGLLRKQSSPKWENTCPGRPWTTVQNLTPLALSSPEKSVTIQTNTHTNTQTVTDLCRLSLSACVDNKQTNVPTGQTGNINIMHSPKLSGGEDIKDSVSCELQHSHDHATSVTSCYITQVWRPSSSSSSSYLPRRVYTLVGQTYVEPTELRFHEIVLHASEFIGVRAGDVLGLYFASFNPIGWSAVPCGSVQQRYAYIRSPVNVTVGGSFHFRSATAGRNACRYYSFAALFGRCTVNRFYYAGRVERQKGKRVDLYSV